MLPVGLYFRLVCASGNNKCAPNTKVFNKQTSLTLNEYLSWLNTGVLSLMFATFTVTVAVLECEKTWNIIRIYNILMTRDIKD